ncbi:hypothetical protein LTR94_032079, partial [Friedmanniomyces endolithicus]
MTATDQSADAAITDPIEAELQAALSAVRTVEARCKDAFLPHLLDHGIVRVEIHYDGGGDQGSVGDVNAYTLEGEIALPRILCDHHSLAYSGE